MPSGIVLLFLATWFFSDLIMVFWFLIGGLLQGIPISFHRDYMKKCFRVYGLLGDIQRLGRRSFYPRQKGFRFHQYQ